MHHRLRELEDSQAQQNVLPIVECIVDMGIDCLTIHYRTCNTPPCKRILVHRLKEIIDFVQGLGCDVAVIENGDCVGFEDARWLMWIPL